MPRFTNRCKFKNLNFTYIKNTRISDKKKSLALSLILATSLVFLLFFIRFWPPSNINKLIESGGGGGVTINFGNTDLGAAPNLQNTDFQKTVNAKIKNTIEQTTEDVITSVNSDVDAETISNKKTTKNTVKKVSVKDVIKTEIKKPLLQKTDDALANLLRNNSKGGNGKSGSATNQGRPNGSISATAYSGGSESGNQNGIGAGNGSGSGNGLGSGNGKGSGNGSGYSLGNRKAISKPAPIYNCNEQGCVVVEITVDRNGQVTAAKAGIKGTTNTANCLLSQAKIAALSTKWEASSSAPDLQIGKIVYNFSLN